MNVAKRQAQRMTRLVVDASVVLKGYIPEEGSTQAQEIFKDRALGHVELLAPTLISYEVANALLVASRKRRLDRGRAEEILREFADLGLITYAPVGLEERTWALAQEFGRTAYDAAYLALAEREKAPFVTGDRQLYNAVKGKLSLALYIEEYRPKALKER